MTASSPTPATLTYEQLMASLYEMKERQQAYSLALEKREKEREKEWEEIRTQQRETDRILKESIRESRERAAKLDKEIARHGNRLGELIEAMVEGGIKDLFKKLGYSFETCNRRYEFNVSKLDIYGEIDLFLENGDTALLVEVKTNLSVDDVRDHIERLAKFRAVADFKGDKRHFIAAVGGGVVQRNVCDFALKQGMFVVRQSGENVEIIQPEGKPRVW
jgi:hypothetical protein